MAGMGLGRGRSVRRLVGFSSWQLRRPSLPQREDMQHMSTSYQNSRPASWSWSRVGAEGNDSCLPRTIETAYRFGQTVEATCVASEAHVGV